MIKKLSKPVFLLIVLTISSFVLLAYPFFAKDSQQIVYIDVSTKKGVEILAKKEVAIEDFHDLNVYQEFNLTFFSSTTLDGLEFRIKCLKHREVNLLIDDVTLYDLESQEQVFWESAADKPQKGPSWYTTEDQEASNQRVVQMDSEVRTESWLYGPYLYSDVYGESLENRKLCATFRMKITDELLPIYVAELSVGVNDFKTPADCLAQVLVDLATIKDENTYNTFNLTFTVPTNVTQGVEFRVTNRNNGYCTLLVDEINVYKNNLNETVYSESSTSKPVSGEGWVETTDLDSSCLKVMFISSSQSNEQILYGPQIVSDANGNSMLGETYVASFRIKIIKI